MDGDFFSILIKTLFSLAFVVFLIYLSMKLSGASLNKLQDGKFVQIVERVAVSKDSSFLIVKLGAKHYLASSTHERLELLRELDAEEQKQLLEKRSNAKPTLATLQDLYPNFLRKGRS